MSVAAAGDKGHRNTLVGIFTVGLLLVCVVAWVLYDSYVTAWSHAVDTSTNLVTALERDIDRTVETYDLSLKAALRGLLAPELASLSPETRQALLFDGSTEAKHMGSLFITDAAGRVVQNSGDLTPPPASSAERDYFTIQRDRSDAGLYISKPFRSRVTGEWSIALSRRISDDKGTFLGIVAGAIQFSYFSELFSKLDLGPGGAISLFGLDGTAIYRTPALPDWIGQDYSQAVVFREIHAGRTAPVSSRAQVDRQPKLFAYSMIGELPLVLSVSVANSTIFADWYTKAVLISIVSIMLAAFGTLLVLSARSQNARRVRAEQAAVHSSQMLQAYFDHSPDALFVVLVGLDGRLTYEKHNQACMALSGLEDGRALGRQPGDVFEPDVAAAVEQRYRACIESGQTSIYQDSRMLPGGRAGLARRPVPGPRRRRHGHPYRRAAPATSRSRTGASAEQRQTKQDGSGRPPDRRGGARLQQLPPDDHGQPGDPYPQTTWPTRRRWNTATWPARRPTSGARLTHRLLAFSRQQVLRPRRVGVATLLGDTRKLVGSAGFGPGIQFKIAVEPFTDDIHVDPIQAESSLLNLLFNARDAMPAGGSLVLHARDARPTDGLCGDAAAGRTSSSSPCTTPAPAWTRRRAPGRSTRSSPPRPSARASGLGLSMAQGFCQQSGGEIRILSGGAVGTRVELWLPAASAAHAAGEEINSNLASIGRTTGRVLLVEDEHDVSLALSAALVSGGFEVVPVINGRDGLARLGDRDPYDAVLSDYAMPDMTGTDFFKAAARIAPALPMLMISGSDVDEATLRTAARPIRLLRKPMRRPDLLAALRDVIAEVKLERAA